MAAKEDRVSDAEAGDEPAAARADDGLIVHPVGKAGARLELAPTDLGEGVGIRTAAMQIVVDTGRGFGEAAIAGRRPAAARDHHAVVTVGACRSDHDTVLDGYRLG